LKECAQHYQELFKTHIEPNTLEAIRVATNKDRVLGNDKFIKEIELMLARRKIPYKHNGDRKSESFKQSLQINDL